VPLHTPTVRVPRIARAAAVAGACMSAGAATVAMADDQPSRHGHSIPEPSRPAATRYFDIEANKAASMRALGLRIAQQRVEPTPRYQDLEANKARSRRAR
jgi:hypothetical protein